ncbi:alkaline phosphatase family protein [Halorubrum rutilum]|uniref:Alkaline phosphatase family protein n=1 Tax=Halorubrum rutilum TaxID=1364933 RepID=A0ABD6AJH7_9EURY|nr:alkaline phosphatase family protein [Halorubrum rutilum]
MELLVIGLDGLSTNMLDRFDIEPEYINRVLENGASGDLMSVDTPTTLPAWTSFATGKDPGSHGLTNMIQQASDYETSPLRTNTTDAAAYDLIDDALFVNLPASAGRVPAAEDTHLVSAMLAEDEEDAVPSHLQQLDAFEDYILDHDKSLKKNPQTYFDHVCDITRARRDFAAEAFDEYDPRLGFVLFSTPDWAGHLLSNFSDDETRGRYYRQLLSVVDTCAQDLAERADNVVLMSDHGFERKHTNIHINDFLHQRGYLRESESSVSAANIAVQTAKAIGKRSSVLYEKIRQLYNYIIATDVGQTLQEAAEPNIDYRNSKAWQLRYGCVFINDKRFDHPAVDDPDALRRQLQTELADLTDDDGSPLFRDVLLAEEAYSDPDKRAPDVIARPAPGCYPTLLKSPTGGYASHTNNFNHRYNGLFAAMGPLFAEKTTVETPSIVDVLPTIMAVLGMPLSPEFDGKVIEAATADEYSVEYRDSDTIPHPQIRTDSDQGARDEAVQERLEDLGYLE